MVEVNTAEQIDVKYSGIAVAYVTNNVEVEKATDLDIRVTKKEYSIVGDDIYIPQLYDDAPQWMKDLVQLVVDVSLTSGTTDLVNQLNSTLSAFATSYVPLNQYTQSIISLQDADTAINSLITTLNSTYNDGISNLSGQIIELQSTKASASEVVAQVISTINSELISPTSNLNATIGNLQQTIANESSARAANFETISSTLETLDGEISGNAEVTNNILTYVGIDGAGASTNTGLSAYLESNGVVGGADSQVVNGVYIEGGIPKSKWQYNSVLNVNGVYYKTGFGLSTNYVGGNGTSGSPYESEFWIDASRFKFTNSNQTGQVAPFTIDASGSQPQITFNGKVSFSNVTDVPQLGSTPQEVVDAVNGGQTTTINGGKITTGSITAAQIATRSISADRLMAGTNSSTVWSGGGLISENFNGNPYGNIGSPTQGFRLSSGAVGTETDPNIYGAYIKGAIVDGSYMKYSENSLFLTAYNTLAPYAIFSSVNGYGSGLFYFDRLYSPTGSGADVYRLSKYNQKVTVFGGFAGDYDVIYAAIQYKYDNDATWYTTFTRSIYADYRAGVAFSSSFNLKSTPYNYVDVRINVYGNAPEASSATLQVSNI